MGNVCGCVRAEKEEQCLDPAKAPLNPPKHSPGRRYFRRKTRKKSTEERTDSEQNKEKEEKSHHERQSSEDREILSKGMALGDSFPQRMPADSNILPVSTEISVDFVQAEALPNEESSNSFHEDGFHGDNQSDAKSDEIETWLNEQDKRSTEKVCEQKRKYLYNGNTRELTFQENVHSLSFEKAASLNFAIFHSGREHEETGLSEFSFRITEDIPERKNYEKLYWFPSETKSDPQSEEKRSHSSDAVFPHISKEKAFYSISPNSSKVNILEHCNI